VVWIAGRRASPRSFAATKCLCRRHLGLRHPSADGQLPHFRFEIVASWRRHPQFGVCDFPRDLSELSLDCPRCQLTLPAFDLAQRFSGFSNSRSDTQLWQTAVAPSGHRRPRKTESDAPAYCTAVGSADLRLLQVCGSSQVVTRKAADLEKQEVCATYLLSVFRE